MVFEGTGMDRGLERELDESGLHTQWDEQIMNFPEAGD